jgi:DNA-directed RNA polymerase subunit E'/Rpb7
MASTTVKRTTTTTTTTTVIRPKKKKIQPTATDPEPEPVKEPMNEPAPEPTSSYCDPILFTQQQIKRRLVIPFYRIKQHVDVKQLLVKELANQLEGRCSIEGYIIPNSISISTYSCGTLNAANIIFDIVAECLICFPEEHSVIKCIARTITQAGIRAGAMGLRHGCISPIEVFLSRDMNMKHSELFNRIEESDILTVEIIGRRFVLHDTHVTVIAMLLDAESPPESQMQALCQ